MNVIHIHTIQIFVYFDSINRPKDLIDRAIELGLAGIAITDHECLSSHPEINFYAQELIKEHPDKINESGYGNSDFNAGLKQSKYAYEIKHVDLLSRLVEFIVQNPMEEIAKHNLFEKFDEEHPEDAAGSFESEIEETYTYNNLEIELSVVSEETDLYVDINSNECPIRIFQNKEG